ncbi:restriction endonuclease subunit M [Novosphingobium mangrovi (ex Huang et al. 2023)]|uniref:N-6 DNA methylase n=1 Tax=Novosphingobium mangrovi (ex Huang et al. 2023) TaxID=2976432 RepID=A0ABT2I719_9SPHN|nr:N-6 DNA methylase [Novosphingobium mangrovi (ex Huang et al. 2023)]MCT2400598.1 N-6 DNA methylase [Novosphingobium mangrovi (ex Huang et al. 2023)]
MKQTSSAAWLQSAIDGGHIQILASGRSEKVRYVAPNVSERWSDPEEKVRASYYAELVCRYGYDPECIGIEVTVPDRVPHDRADIVLFRDKAKTKPYAVIECKRDGVTDTELKQAIEQAFGNGHAHKFRAEYIGVIAGQTRAFYDCSDRFGVLEREANIIADLPVKYGKPEEFKYYHAAPPKPDISAVGRDDLIKTIRKCHQTLWGGGRLSPPTAFGELCKLIFVKTRDEKKPRKRGEAYEFQIKSNETPDRLAKRIRSLYDIEREREPDVFTDTIKIDDVTLKNVVLHLESVNLTATDLDTKGVAFEQFMDGFFKGDFGQYFTPRNIIAFAVQMLGIDAEDTVIDPACGSGGFLLHALDHVRAQAGQYYDEGTSQHFNYWHDFAEKRLFGVEINEEIARVAKMNMIVHDDGHTNVIGNDALEPLTEIADKNEAFARILGIDRATGKRDETKGFTKIPTNPPFGAVVKEELHTYLSSYELSRYVAKGNADDELSDDGWDPRSAKKAVKQRASVKTEIIYVERIWQLLKPGGQAAVVLPDGLLTNASLQGVRDWLLERFKVLAVISLPQFAFAHFGAGVKSSVVFLEKRPFSRVKQRQGELIVVDEISDDEPIFMAMAENVGYDAAGRNTYEVEVLREDPNVERVERHRCDLFDWEVIFDWKVGEGKKPGDWTERHRKVMPSTGLLGQYANFQRDPTPFFV